MPAQPLGTVLREALAALPGVNPTVVWTFALLAALAYGLRRAERQGLDSRVLYWTGVCAIAAGLWGGHVLALLGRGDGADLQAWLRLGESGKSFYGGLLGGVIGGVGYLRLRRQSVGAYVDIAVPAIALGYAVGRVGCFLNGDDYGVVTQLPWAVSYPPDTEAYLHHLNRGWIAADATASLPVHPVQLYLAALGLVVFLATRRGRFTQLGQRAALCAVLYGCGRFVLELWRGDPRPMLGVLSLPQIMSIGLILAVSLWYVASGRRVHSPLPRSQYDGDHDAEVNGSIQMASLH